VREDTERLLVEAGLDAAAVDALVRAALTEDLGGGVDVTSVATVPFDLVGTAEARARQSGVLAGVPVAVAVLDIATDGDFVLRSVAADGTTVQPGDGAFTVDGLVRGLLTAERTMLNLLCHLSGVATATRRWADALAGTGAVVRDTRKTTPGLRALEKYAVRCGGGVNHRMGLSDAALVKDNHVQAAGGVTEAFRLVRQTWPDLPVEVECDTVQQVREVLAAGGVDLVLLDNMTLEQTRESVALCRAAGTRTEASGGLTLASARAVGQAGVDFIAVGALTHSAPVLDLGLDLRALDAPGVVNSPGGADADGG